jgi:hypothetical protein
LTVTDHDADIEKLVRANVLTAVSVQLPQAVSTAAALQAVCANLSTFV